MRSVRISTHRFMKVVVATILLAVLLSLLIACTHKDEYAPTIIQDTQLPRVIFFMAADGKPVSKFISSSNPKSYDSGMVGFIEFGTNTEIYIKAPMFVELPLDKYSECLKREDCQLKKFDIDYTEE